MKKLISALISLLAFIVSPTLVSADSVTLSPSVDTYIYSVTPNQRYNNERDLLVFFDRQTNAITYPLIKFSLDQIPAGSQVHRVNLILYQKSAEGESPLKLGFVSQGGDWNSNVTFNTKPPSGGFFTMSIDDDRSVGFKTWNLSSHVRQWVERTAPNYGLKLLKSEGINDQSYKRVFASSEDPNPNLRPKLTVEYDLPSPEQAAAAAGQNQGGGAANVPVNAINPAGNINIKPIATIGPIIGNIPQFNVSVSEVKSENITDKSAKISWKTNNNSTSWVFFGIATNGDLFNVMSGQSDSVKNHSVSLSNLYPDRKYSYKVFSKDANGKQAFGPINYFTTTQSGQAAVAESPVPSASPTPSPDSNLISDLQENIENKVVEAEINKSLSSGGNIASEIPGSGSAVPEQTEFKSSGVVSLFAGMVGVNKLAGFLLIVLGLMSIVGLMLLYFIGKKAHHHIRKHFDKNYAKRFKKRNR